MVIPTWSSLSETANSWFPWLHPHFERALAAVGPLEKLPPPTRAAVLMALLGIALVGLLLVVVILLGGHWVRRQGNFRRGPSVPPDRPPLPHGSAAGESGITLSNDPEASQETVISDTTATGKTVQP